MDRVVFLSEYKRQLRLNEHLKKPAFIVSDEGLDYLECFLNQEDNINLPAFGDDNAA